MAGLSAILTILSDRTTTQALCALSDALAPRGSDETAVEHGAARLLVRAALPKVFEFNGAAMIVDGIAEVSALAARYAELGPPGLLHGPHPFAMILSDPDGLVLARHQDGPPLYYARSRGAVLVASEPGALLAAGVPAEVNESVAARFLATGVCDEIPATFFEPIRRVLPGQVVEVSRHTGAGDGWAIRAHPAQPNRLGRITMRMALLGALGDGRCGVALLGAGQPDIALPTAALLGTALAERDAHRSMPVYSMSMPQAGLGVPGFVSSVLGPIPDGAIRQRVVPFFTDEIDIDGFVTDLGEPIPHLSGYLLWALARATGGEVDALLAATGWAGPAGHLSRLTDRVASRYGVALRFPFRDREGSDAERSELQTLAERTLPHASTRAVMNPAHPMEPDPLAVLQRLRPELAAAMLYPRVGERDDAALMDLGNLARADLDRLWRHYVLQRWLAVVVKPERVNPVPAARPAVESGQWSRHAIVTEPLLPGDRLADKLAWYVAEFVTGSAKRTRHPWYLMIAAKAVSVAQGRATPVWEIVPGRLARWLARMATGTRYADPWTMQVALAEMGRARMVVAALCARLGRPGWFKAAPKVSPPRESACPPAHLSVTAAPERADDLAAAVIGTLEKILPLEAMETLAGCAIVSVDGRGWRVAGWAGLAAAAPGVLEKICAGNPFGQAAEGTPIVVVLSAAKPQRGQDKGGAKPSKGQDKGRRQAARRG